MSDKISVASQLEQAIDELAVVGGFSNTVSMALTGQQTTRQGELASMVHAKACAHARSIGAISHSSMFDHSGIIGLSRMVLECLTMYAYLTESIAKELWDLRYLVLRLHDTSTRIKLLRAWREKGDYADLLAGRAQLVKQIEQNEAWLSLENEKRARLVTGEVMFIDGMRNAAVVAGWDADVFLAIFNYFSSHAHGAPISFFRMAHHKIDYFAPSDTQREIAALAVTVAAACLRRLSLRHLGDLNWQKDHVLAATVPEFQRADRQCGLFVS